MKRVLQLLASSRFSTNYNIRDGARAFVPYEALEQRVLLSGSVLASVSDGNLFILGDAAANVIVLDQVGLSADQVRISGTSETTINDQASVIMSGVTGRVTARMGAGVDSVSMHDLTLPGSMLVNGQRDLTLSNVHVTQGLSVLRTPITTMTDTTVGEDLMILPGTGRHVNAVLKGVEVQRNTQIVGWRDADSVRIDDSTFHGAVSLQIGRGADTVQIDSNGDPLGSPTVFDGPVSIEFGGGGDTLQIGVAGEAGNRAVFARKVLFDGGPGFDTILNPESNTFDRPSRVQIVNFESAVTAPGVSATDPTNAATDVPSNRIIAVTFDTAMDPTTITTGNFRVAGPGSTPVTGSVAYAGMMATFTPDSPLTASTTYTATITTGAKDLAGTPLASDFTWTFTTGAAADTLAPTVQSTDPAANATGVALNQKVAATFSESMDALTITSTNFTVTGPGSTPVTGSVAYVGTTATFTPDSPLAGDTTYTATITTGAKDLAGNALASDFTWTFTTGAAPDTIAPTITSTNPANLKTNVALNKTVSATFSEAMDPLTITSANFTLTAPGNVPVAGTVTYDALSNTATFAPSGLLDPSAIYTATILGGVSGVKDLAGNAPSSDFTWTFTTGTQIAQAPIDLGLAGPFAVMATASISGTGSITGDVGLNPGTAQGFPPSSITGNIFVGGTEVVAAQAALLAAYNDAVSRSTTSVDLPGNVGGLTFTPGLYTNSTSVLISGSGPGNNVTLDAQGDPDAIFIFKMGSTLTTGTSAQVILTNGAKAANIFWVVGSSATVEANTIFKGNILAAVTITVNNGAVVEGRLFAGSGGESTGAVTVNGATVTLPLA